ncbi:MAG: hypothetical protein WC804_21475 [Sphingomonas sp.]|jgi:hypothetical protein
MGSTEGIGLFTAAGIATTGAGATSATGIAMAAITGAEASNSA